MAHGLVLGLGFAPAVDGKTSATFLLRRFEHYEFDVDGFFFWLRLYEWILESNGEEKRGKRDEKGRFVSGGPPGPGRPKAAVIDITTHELLKLARPLDESTLQLLVMQLQATDTALDELRDRPGISPTILASVELQVQTQRMASVALFKRLHAASL